MWSARGSGTLPGLHGLHLGHRLDRRADHRRLGDRSSVLALDLLDRTCRWRCSPCCYATARCGCCSRARAGKVRIDWAGAGLLTAMRSALAAGAELGRGGDALAVGADLRLLGGVGLHSDRAADGAGEAPLSRSAAAAAAVRQRGVRARRDHRLLRRLCVVRRQLSCCRCSSSWCAARMPPPPARWSCRSSAANCVGAWCRRRAGAAARQDEGDHGRRHLVACMVGFVPAVADRCIDAETPRYRAGGLPAVPGLRHRHGHAECTWSACRTPPSGATWDRRPGACCSCARWAARSAARWSALCWPAGSPSGWQGAGHHHAYRPGRGAPEGCGAGRGDAGDDAARPCGDGRRRFIISFLACAVGDGRRRWWLRSGMRDLPLRTAVRQRTARSRRRWRTDQPG